MPGRLLEPVEYAKFRKSCAVASWAGEMQELSAEMIAPPTPLVDGMIAAVHTSFADRNRLKSRTSDEVLPSRIRTLTTLPRLVVLTTDSSVLYAEPAMVWTV